MLAVLVIDDQRTFADLLQGALTYQPDMCRVDVAYELSAGLDLIDQNHHDVVVLDVHFAGDSRDGVDAASEIKLRYPDTRVVLLTGQSVPSLIGRAAEVGANALVAKNGSLAEILQAIRSDTSGLTISPLIFQSLSPAHEPGPGVPVLTKRESDVLAMLVLGLDAKAISHHLQISLNTCRSYIKTLLNKLHAHSQLEAVAIARSHGLLDAIDSDEHRRAEIRGNASYMRLPRQPSSRG